jgi:hypothetical protein
MKSRRLGWILAALFLVTSSMGTILAQDQDQQSAQLPVNESVQNNAPDNNASGPYDSNAPYDDSAPGQGNAPAQQVQDPPGRVARVQYMSGEVSMQPGGVNDWVAASQNRPLTTADRVWTDKSSRAELNVGDGFIRMNSETSLTLSNVGNETVQLELDQGVLEVTVRHLERGEIYEIDTPNLAFTVMKSGVYRFDVDPNGDQTLVTVRSGYGEATGKGSAVRVNSGQQVRFSGSNSLTHTAQGAPARDGFDDWAQVRDKRLENSVSARYVSPGVIGYQDLDAYGVWQDSPQYGSVWVPTSVQPGWAPYRYGHWAWIQPWGWTWVDDAPWGFAPFHYGRWVDWNGGWGWAPGPLGYWDPYYAPALVGWIGGGGFGIGFGWGGGWGIGGFGWFPLGWGEPFFPRYCGWGHGGWGRGGGWGYRGGNVSNGYLRNVNVTNTRISNFNNIASNYHNNNFAGTNYAFRNRAGAVTAAPKSAFTSGAAINRVGTVVPKSALGKGQLVGAANVAPTRQSVLGGRTPLTTHGVPPASATNRSVVTHATPPARSNGNQSAMARGNGAASTQGNRNVAHGPGATASANQGNAAHNVPRPPASNNSFARGNANSANNHSAMNRPPQGTTTNRGPQGTATARNSQVPRPPANYTYRPPSGTPQRSAPSHQSAPSQHAAPQGNSRGGSQGNSPHGGNSQGNSGSAPRTTGSAARPPAGYAYHAAPAYSPSSRYGSAGSASSYAGGNSRGSYPSASGYDAGRSYGSSPTYSARSYGSPGSYSAPRSYSGGGGGYRGGGGGGGGSHSSGGGGGHSGGGGGGHSGGGHR